MRMRAATIVIVMATGTLASCKTFYVRDVDVEVDSGAASSDASSYCAVHTGTATLCDDFDTGDVPGVPAWTSASQVGGVAIMTLDSRDFTSAPRSLLIVKPTGDPSLNVESWLRKNFSAEAMGAVLAFDVRIDDVGEGFNLAVLHQGNLDLVLAQYSANQTSLREEATGGGLLKEDPASSPIVPGAWHHVELDSAFADRRIRVTFDNKSVIDAAFDAKAIATGAAPLAGVGIVYAQGPSRVQVRYDNVTVSLR